MTGYFKLSGLNFTEFVYAYNFVLLIFKLKHFIYLPNCHQNYRKESFNSSLDGHHTC